MDQHTRGERSMDTGTRLRDFHYHQVPEGTSNKMVVIREQYYALACLLLVIPECREKSLALTHLEESLMRAIQALAVLEGVKIPLGDSDIADI